MTHQEFEDLYLPCGGSADEYGPAYAEAAADGVTDFCACASKLLGPEEPTYGDLTKWPKQYQSYKQQSPIVQGLWPWLAA